MTYEHETPTLSARPSLQERKDANAKKLESDLAAAKAAMAAFVHAPHDDDTALDGVLVHQGHILNGLFQKTLVDNARPSHSAESLAFAVTLQRECRHTIQAVSRVRRTSALTLSEKNTVKRTDSEDRLYSADGRLIYDFSVKD
jgi:hypothetical protein